MELMIDTEIVKRLRAKRSWTQEHLAEVSGVSLRTVQRIEKGGVCSLESIQALAAVFEVAALELQVDESEKKRNRHYRRVLIWSFLGTTLGFLFGTAGTTYSLMAGNISGGQAGIYYGSLGAIAGFSYVFVALILEYCRKHRVGEWQNNI